MPQVDINRLNIRMRGVSQKQALVLVDGLQQSILKHVLNIIGSKKIKGINHIPEMHIQPLSVSGKTHPETFQKRAAHEISRSLNKKIGSIS